jgi:hypothetical protein
MIKDLLNSFKNDKAGYSGRKLSAFIGVATAIYLTIFKIPLENQLESLMVWLSFSLLCLGIVTVQNVIEFKNGSNKG